MGNLKDYENSQDCSYWNRRLKKAIATYQTATNEENFEEKRMLTLVILQLFEESHDYEIDEFKFDDEQLDLATKVRDIVTGKCNIMYPNFKEDWDMDLTGALQQGDMIKILKLVQSGKSRNFVRKDTQPYSEHYEAVKQLTDKISRNIKREEETKR